MLVRRSSILCGAILLLALLAACGGGRGTRPPSPTSSATELPTIAPSAGPSTGATATTTASPIATPATVRGIEVRHLGIAEPSLLERGIVVYWEAARFQSHGYPNTLYRTHTTVAGAERTVDLFLKFRTVGAIGVYTWVADPAMDELVIAVCDTGSCGTGVRIPQPGETERVSCYNCRAQPSGASDGRVYRSLDGGITWNESGRLPSGSTFVGWRNGAPLVRVPGFHANGRTEIAYESWPNGQPQSPPLPGLDARSFDRGTLLWLDSPDSGRLYNDAGDLIFVPQDGLEGHQYYAGNLHGSALTLWSAAGSGQSLLFQLDPQGAIARAWSFGPNTVAGIPGVFAGKLLATLNTPASGYQVVSVDMARSLVTPLPAFGEAVRAGGVGNGPRVVRARAGDFAEITGTGSCLNLRQRPDTDGPVLACYADGVLLEVVGKDGVPAGWLPVIAPGGMHAWANATYLSR